MLDLARLPELQRLNLSQTRITDRGVLYLKDARNLVDVNLSFAENIGDPAHAVIKDWKLLKRISLRGTVIGDNVAAALASLPHLEVLDISHTDLLDFGLEALSLAPALKQLHMGGTRITEFGFQALRQFASLEYLDLSGGRTASGYQGPMSLTLRSLEAIASLEKLRELRLGYTRFPGRGLAVLGLRKQRAELEVLWAAETAPPRPARR
jgi:Leucine-rich repeat (LRR) protein